MSLNARVPPLPSFPCRRAWVPPRIPVHCPLSPLSPHPAPYLPAGEARTDAFVQANGGEEAAFDHLVEPASLILVTLLKVSV